MKIIMRIIGFLLLIPLTIVKLIFVSINYCVATIILFTIAFVFMILSIFNQEYFWDKLWVELIDWLDKNCAFPIYIK